MKKMDIQPVVPAVQPLQLGLTSQLVFVWAATLLVSSLPDILIRELHIPFAIPILWVRTALLLGFIGVSFVWKTAQPFRPYFIIFLALYALDALFNWVGGTSIWQTWFGGLESPVVNQLLGIQLLRLGVAFSMIVVLWLMRYPRNAFFLAKGDLNAVAEPIHWLGMERPTLWRRFGLILSLCITLGTLAFLVIFSQSSITHLAQVLPVLPLILIIAGMNAFSEEVTYRAALLTPLHPVVGKSQALLLTAALFGLWHYYGVPYGVLGVVMAGILGWLLGKSMLETKGLFWAWFIHFWQDVAIFVFIVAGSIVPGG